MARANWCVEGWRVTAYDCDISRLELQDQDYGTTAANLGGSSVPFVR